MIKELSQDLIKYYIENYGDGDIYFSHYLNDDGTLEVKFLPAFTKFADEENIEEFKKELEEKPHLKDRYLKVIILTERFAHIPNDEYSNKKALVKNFNKFLEDLKAEQKKEEERKYAKKSEFCKQENVKKHKKDKHKHKGGGGR